MNQLPDQMAAGTTYVPVGHEACFTSSGFKVTAGSDFIPSRTLYAR